MMSPHGGPERPLCGTVKVKSGIYERPQDTGDICQEIYRLGWHQLKREKGVAINKAVRSWRSEEHFNTGHRDAEF